ncbi:hypothetical protein [Lactobacillus crispatus]|uniref:Uncharacterized protein n=1 Tax=Lactobacillus crispatus TaxID=47770 RepID=A0AAW6XH47_9LACO|nr:hypothetical protein [Lactobacillus crispatus]MDK6502666.1 hypothetical protein [Lactobacillus crispatus]
MKQHKISELLFGLLVILVSLSLVGLFYSIFYEIKGYMIDWLPDVGTPADFCGAAGTTLAVIFTWQQMKDSDKEAQEKRNETEQQLKKSQAQFNATIKEMRKNREEAYKPDICFDTEMISIQYDNCQNNFGDDFNEISFTIINLGIGTAKNVEVTAYSDNNYNKLCHDISWFNNQTQCIGDVQNHLCYTDCRGKTVCDDIKPLSGKYLFSKDYDKNIDLPKAYLYAVKDYCFELFDDNKISTDPYYQLPTFVYDISYQDQEDIQYFRKVLIKPNIETVK